MKPIYLLILLVSIGSAAMFAQTTKAIVTKTAGTKATAAKSADPKPAASQMDPANCPMHAEHMAAMQAAQKTGDQRFAEMNARGARAMGFDR